MSDISSAQVRNNFGSKFDLDNFKKS